MIDRKIDIRIIGSLAFEKQNSHQISLVTGEFETVLRAAQRIHAKRYYIPLPPQPYG